jgi:hypothetical protein
MSLKTTRVRRKEGSMGRVWNERDTGRDRESEREMCDKYREEIKRERERKKGKGKGKGDDLSNWPLLLSSLLCSSLLFSRPF